MNITNNKWTTFLHHAAKNGHVDVIRELIKLGAHLDATKRNGTTPLYIACIKGKTEAVKVLLSLGADFEKRRNKDHFDEPTMLFSVYVKIMYPFSEKARVPAYEEIADLLLKVQIHALCIL